MGRRDEGLERRGHILGSPAAPAEGAAGPPAGERSMRLAGQKRSGFYAIPPEAVGDVARRLKPPAAKPFSVLDPCAGKGAAVKQLGGLLGANEGWLHAIELDEGRAED